MHLRAVHGGEAHVLSPSYIHSPKLYTSSISKKYPDGQRRPSWEAGDQREADPLG